MTAFIASFILIFLAEMADKTQLLVMAFAARYSAYKVILAVFLATLVNNTLAVGVGRFLTTVVPLGIISFVAALSFIFFALWTIRPEKSEEEDKKKSRFGPILTVGMAFFLAEMGDKTQLATISLAVEYKNILAVLMGTTLAMVAADAFGIIAGVVMRKHIPQNLIKWVSAVIFALFGLLGIYKSLSGYLGVFYIFGILAFVAAGFIYAALAFSKLNK